MQSSRRRRASGGARYFLQEALHVGAKARAAVGLEDEVVAVGDVARAAQRLLGHPQRRRRVAGERLGQLGHVGLGVVGQRAREADRERLVGLDRAGAEHHVLQARRAERLGQAGVVAHREAVADGAGDRHAELRGGRDHAQVAGGGDREAGAHREAVDERDRRLAHGLEAVEHRVDARLVDEAVLRGLELGELADVGAGDERLPARAAQDQTLISSSASTVSQCSTRRSYIANVIALWASGRSNVTHAATPRRSSVTSAIGVELGQDLVGVLAQQRGGAPDRARRGAELDGDAEARARCRLRGAPSPPPCHVRGCGGRRPPARSRGSGRRARRPRAARRPSARSSRAAIAGSSSATSAGPVGHAVGVGGEARVVRAGPRARSRAHSRSHSFWLLPPTVTWPSLVRSAW